MSSVPPRTQVVVIGAGQAGLSVAYYLRRFELEPGVDFVLLDRGPSTGGAWQFRWDALRLGSTHRVSDLPGMSETGLSFDLADRTRPASEIVGEYYRSYEQHFGLRMFRPVAVSSVFDRGADLVVAHGSGETVTRIVVNATGTWGAPSCPTIRGSGSSVAVSCIRPSTSWPRSSRVTGSWWSAEARRRWGSCSSLRTWPPSRSG